MYIPVHIKHSNTFRENLECFEFREKKVKNKKYKNVNWKERKHDFCQKLIGIDKNHIYFFESQGYFTF